MNNERISVIIPVYNTAPYLERCIRSVTENTYENLEIICVNDGSTDDSLEVLNRMAQTDGRIRILNQPNSGVSAARNNGIDAASGAYISFVDSDDQIHEKSFEFLMRAAQESDADVIIGGFQDIYTDQGSRNDIELDYSGVSGPFSARDAFAQRGFFRDAIWGTLYRRSAIGSYRFLTGLSYGEDAFFNTLIRASARKCTFAAINLPLYYYFTRSSSLSNTTQLDKRLASIKTWIAHIGDFDNPAYAVGYILEQAFHYRLSGLQSAAPSVAKRNTRHIINECLPYFTQLHTLGKKPLVKTLLCAFFPSVYIKLLTSRDPSYHDYLSTIKRKNQNYTPAPWEEI